MKVLRIYDHLGQLRKEFNVYVEGEDFVWAASYPEAIWLGTITLVDAGKEPEAEPTPTPEPEKVMPVTEYFPEAFERQPGPEVTEPEPEAVPVLEQALLLVQPERAEPEPEVTKEEVKDEPEKVHRKRGRVKRTSPSDYLKSIKVIRQDDSPGDTTKGD